jgi:hypothetical protein
MQHPKVGNVCPAGIDRRESHEPFAGQPFEPQRMKDGDGNWLVFSVCRKCGAGFAAMEIKKAKGEPHVG